MHINLYLGYTILVVRTHFFIFLFGIIFFISFNANFSQKIIIANKKKVLYSNNERLFNKYILNMKNTFILFLLFKFEIVIPKYKNKNLMVNIL